MRVSLPLVGGPFHSAVADFHEAHPAIDLELDYTNRSVDLVREGFDAAIRWGPLHDSMLKARSLGSYRCVLVGSPAYLAQRGTPRRLRDLREHDLLQLRLSNNGQRKPLGYLGAHREKVECARTPVVANRVEALVDFAVRGRGLAYVADVLIRDERARGALVTVLEEQIGHSTPAHLMWAPGKHVSPKLRVFIDWMAKHFTR
ncbi:LysR substrate-binding domain-containing protein [Sorangium atrum]|uniref:LysR substrate-binding domain-containing protein n=1 Tax=Sorangium atrum TaxID=2995308 RepID=A0ABT5BTC2_9BACT|nr:LysR substrate-binding domain-containing protein [Sorangium aterium]MDC0677405.1 LysR substrate-binding domain-containing protein [Sorangium aterium]